MRTFVLSETICRVKIFILLTVNFYLLKPRTLVTVIKPDTYRHGFWYQACACARLGANGNSGYHQQTASGAVKGMV
jgi:hypothetical protein